MLLKFKTILFLAVCSICVPSFFIPESFSAAESASSQKLDPTAVKPQTPNQEEKKARIFYNIGLRYFSQKNYKDAWLAFYNAGQVYPGYKKVDSYLALSNEKLTQAQKQELERKKKFYSAVKGKYVSDLYATGLYAMERARYNKAIEKFEEALELAPGHQGSRSNLIQAHLLLKRQEAEGESAELENIKGSEEARMNIIEAAQKERLASSYKEARHLLKYNWPKKALNKFEEIYETRPNYKDVQNRIADIRLSLLSQERQLKGPIYTLGPGDVIQITVFSHPELSGPVIVEPGGEVILPLTREAVNVEGLPKEEAAQKIQKVLAKYIQNPEVQVIITGYNSKKWYILGEVGLRGVYPLGRARLTLLDALYQAGLPLEGTAAQYRVVVIKPHPTQPYYRSVNVADLLYKGVMRNNVIIEDGDMIYVPMTVLNKITILTGQIFAPVINLKSGMEGLRDAAIAAGDITPLKEIFGGKVAEGKASGI